MDHLVGPRESIRDFLVTRRARVSVADTGLPVPRGQRRQVLGLRREEVALLAGVSVDYYVRLERGRATGVSSDVVDAVADALRLDDTEREHFGRLLRTAGRARARRSADTPGAGVRPGTLRLMEAFGDLPAFVFDHRLDIRAANDLGRVLYSPLFDHTDTTPNSARFTFLDEPRARALWPQWTKFADHAVAVLRAGLGRFPHDPALTALVAELAAQSGEFRDRWVTHDVLRHTTGTKVVCPPLTGPLQLPFEILSAAGDPDLSIMVYTPRRDSPEHDALVRLGAAASRGRGR